MRMKRTMDILLASRTLEQVDEFRRRSGPDCFFFSGAEESGRSMEQGKKDNNLNQIG